MVMATHVEALGLSETLST